MADTKISALTGATTPLAGTEEAPIVQSATTKKVTVANLTDGRAVTAASLTTTGAVTATGVGGVTINKSAAGGTASLVLANSPSGDGVGRINIVASSTVTNWSINANTVTGGELNITPSTAGGGSTFSTPAWTFLPNSDVKLQVGNLVIGTSGKGIDFSATSNASGMTSELLADYEEGTWTPSLVCTGQTITPSTASGRYTKIGRFVMAECAVIISTVSGSAGGATTIEGLPFSNGGASYSGQGSLGYNDGFTGTISGIWISGTTLVFRNGTRSSGNDANGFTAGGYINLSVVYSV